MQVAVRLVDENAARIVIGSVLNNDCVARNSGIGGLLKGQEWRRRCARVRVIAIGGDVIGRGHCALSQQGHNAGSEDYSFEPETGRLIFEVSLTNLYLPVAGIDTRILFESKGVGNLTLSGSDAPQFRRAGHTRS